MRTIWYNVFYDFYCFIHVSVMVWLVELSHSIVVQVSEFDLYHFSFLLVRCIANLKYRRIHKLIIDNNEMK